MLHLLFGLVIGIIMTLLGLAVGALSLVQLLFLLFVNIPLSRRLYQKKVLISNRPILMGWFNAAAAVILFVLSCLMVWFWLRPYFYYFLTGIGIISLMAALTMKHNENLTHYIVSHRRDIRPEFLKDGDQELPAERARALIEITIEDFE